MSVIAQMVGDTERSSNYSVSGGFDIFFLVNERILQAIASSYVTQWQKFATSSSGKHLTLSVSILDKNASVQADRLSTSTATLLGELKYALQHRPAKA